MKRFLIYISQAYSIPIGLPLQNEIEKRGFSIKWFCDEVETQDTFFDKTRLLFTVHDVISYNPDVILVATNEVPDFFPGLKVQIFHGFSVGKRSESKGHFNIRGFFDLYCTQGPSTTTVFQKLSKKHKYFKVVETGWSKVDPLFPLETAKKNAIPIVMLSSTFSTRLSLAHNESIVNEVLRLSKLHKWKFIVVLHPKMQKKIVQKFLNIQHDFLIFYDTVDLIPLYKMADVMLSDTTSAIAEFILQKKPVVTVNNNKPASYMIDVSCAHEIENALEYALSYPKEIIDDIDVFIEKTHPYSDGKSSQRVIDATLHFLEHESIKPKPLNLIRRIKIRKKLNHLKF